MNYLFNQPPKLNNTKPILAFDWGDTLMVNNRRFNGPMESWPSVRACEGARQALETLSPRFNLVVATNTTESNAAQVRAALDRVELGAFLSAIYTPFELHAYKPEPAFYHAIQRASGVAPGQAIMVGDDFWADVSGSWQAGWRCIWLNPAGQACPGLVPPHDAEINSLAELPSALEEPPLPSLNQCQGWLLDQGASYDVLAHVNLVAAASYLLAVELRSRGVVVDPVLAHRGGLLHDLAKISSKRIGPNANHGEVGASLLRDLGQNALAEIAGRHLLFRLGTEDGPHTWEEKLVHFIDKLAEGNSLVPLDVRLAALSQRYQADAERFQVFRQPLLELQAEIAGAAGLSSAELLPFLQASLHGK